MGRSITPKYIVETTEQGGRKQQMIWRGRGRPTAAQLERWVLEYLRSFQVGGVNEHISRAQGYIPHASRAVVRENNSGGRVVAQWTAPMFMVL